jgi:hypothetical protein
MVADEVRAQIAAGLRQLGATSFTPVGVRRFEAASGRGELSTVHFAPTGGEQGPAEGGLLSVLISVLHHWCSCGGLQ